MSSFIYPAKMWESKTFSKVFKEYINGPLSWYKLSSENIEKY